MRQWRRSVAAGVVACALIAPPAPAAAAWDPGRWDATIERLSPAMRDRMRGSSWHRGCPVGLDRLRLIRMPYRGFDGDTHDGRMVVRASRARDVRAAFHDIYDAGFRIRRMVPVDRYDGDDDASMAANNTSAFNCRRVAGTDRWSEHAYGRALDINPVQNPWVSGSSVEPPAGEKYTDRSDRRRGMVVRPSPVIRAFARIGWEWGGDWSSSKDYQHFSSTGG